MTQQELLIVAGEASGDLHGARLLTALQERRPGIRAFGFGGGELRQAGLDPVSEESIAVVGITEVLKILPKAKRVFRNILDEVDRRRPAAAVLIDFPEFNLRLAKELQARGVPVIYYISPQVWAWRRYRVRGIAKVVDRMLVLFPFEVEFYRHHGVAVEAVGHPLVDEVAEVPPGEHIWDREGDQRGSNEESPFHIALLPGSRLSELERLLPVMLQSVEAMAREIPVFVRLIQAPTIPDAALEEALAASPVPVRVVREDRHRALADCHLALCASGTATLETALVGTPMIVLYRLTFWSYLLARLLVRLPHFSLVNLVLERGVVPELIQGEVAPEKVARQAVDLLRDRQRIEDMRSGLGQLRRRLGRGGASERAAAAVALHLEGLAESEGSAA